jgi:hypothetical protein
MLSGPTDLDVLSILNLFAIVEESKVIEDKGGALKGTTGILSSSFL